MEIKSIPTNICFCVHGAAQILTNPQVRKALALPELEEELSLSEQVREIKKSLTPETWNKGGWFKVDGEYNIAAAASTPATARFISAASRGAAATAQTNNLFAVWSNRPVWVRENVSNHFSGVNYGKTELSYLLGMFGITTAFNDAEETTLEMLHSKLDEVIKFACDNDL